MFSVFLALASSSLAGQARFACSSISLVNDSELHDHSHFEDLVCGSRLHGRQHTLMLLVHSPVLTTFSGTLPAETSEFTSWNVAPSEGKCGRHPLAFEEIINN